MIEALVLVKNLGLQAPIDSRFKLLKFDEADGNIIAARNEIHLLLPGQLHVSRLLYIAFRGDYREIHVLSDDLASCLFVSGDCFVVLSSFEEVVTLLSNNVAREKSVIKRHRLFQHSQEYLWIVSIHLAAVEDPELWSDLPL